MSNINDPKGAAGALKAPLWLIPSHAMDQTSWVHKLGAEKYGEFNWRKTGVCASTYVNAILRHLNAWRDGETVDPESGISHLAHVACSCNILLDAGFCGTLQDDRNITPPNTPARKMDRPEQIPSTEYRLLKEEELIQEGDEYYCSLLGRWFSTNIGHMSLHNTGATKYRRKVDHTEGFVKSKGDFGYVSTFKIPIEFADEPEECSCGRYKINHFTLGMICEDCELKWQDPY